MLNTLRELGEGGVSLFWVRAALLFIIASFALAVGCARTVTQIVSYGDQMVVEVTLRGTMEVSANRYFLVLASSESYRIPLPSPDLIESAPEFFEPGDTPQIGSEEAYYSNFFSTWAAYILTDPAGYTLVKSPFVKGVSASREVISSLGEIGTTIRFVVRLGRVFDTVPDRIYFDFASVPWPNGEAKIPADHLPSTNNSVSNVAGSMVSLDDSSQSELDASLDILNCKVEIQ